MVRVDDLLNSGHQVFKKNDCISKTRKANEGEAPMYIVENNHPAIISRELFNRTQEELSRRNVMTPKSKKSCITASGKYSKYALTEVLKCAECGSRYRRCTWTSHGHRRIVWRCINRLDYGKKYCPDSITVSETALQEAMGFHPTDKIKPVLGTTEICYEKEI